MHYYTCIREELYELNVWMYCRSVVIFKGLRFTSHLRLFIPNTLFDSEFLDKTLRSECCRKDIQKFLASSWQSLVVTENLCFYSVLSDKCRGNNLNRTKPHPSRSIPVHLLSDIVNIRCYRPVFLNLCETAAR